MLDDILTVMWKEFKGLLRSSGSRWKSVTILVTPIAIFGLIFPIQFRQDWLAGYWSLAVAVVTPMLLIATTIAESFAGERERHTLETLLASRLPDRAILLGKLFASLLFGWGMTLFLLVVSLVTVNVFGWAGQFLFYQPAIFWMDLAASLLMSGMVSSLGILISLRAPTVQNAAQTIMLALFMPLLLLQAAVFLLPTFVPVESIKARLAQLNFESIITIFLVVLVAANIGLFLGATARFKRSKLILS
ncbi:MAG: ABC transporter permease [Anaerolineales bacterium]